MDKIKKSLLAVIVLVSSVAQLIFLSSGTAYAAPARCFDGTGEDFRVLSSCPTSNGFRDTSNQVVPAPLDDRCYQGNFTPGPNITVYVEGDCSSLNTLATQVERNICQNSGGSWAADTSRIDPATGNVVMSCSCSSGNTLVQRACETAPQTNQPDESQPTSVDGRLTSRPNDCNQENLDGDNCGIINYLNIFMNLVSGAIAIAVIGNIIYAGIQYSMAQGDPGNVGKAKTRIRNALIAFIMYVSLFGFLQWLIPGGVF